MENVKYIPGDWIKIQPTENWFAEDKEAPLQVVECDANGTLMVVERNYDKKSYLIYEVDIMPIPLTEEILEKNGWEKDGGQYVFKFRPCGETEVEFIGFFTEMFKDVHSKKKYPYFLINFRDKVIGGCFYAHQLQHLLFGLGLDSSLKV